MTDISQAADPYEDERVAQRQALGAELRDLEQRDDQTSLERRYELHCLLTWLVCAPGTDHAQEHAEHALALARRLADPQREVRALHLLGQAYLASQLDPTQEQSRTAQGFHEEALSLREAMLGPDHPDVAESLMQILGQGRLWWPIQPYVAMAERAVAIFERALGPEHERTCAALERLALMRHLDGDYAEALAIHERLLAIYARTAGSDAHHRIQDTIRSIAGAHRALGNHAAALALMRDELSRLRSTLSDHHASVLALNVEIGQVLRQLGEDTEAEAEIAHVLAQLEAEFGPDHPSTLAFLAQVAASYLGHHDESRARQLYEQVVAGYQRAGAQGYERLYAMMSLFSLRWRQGDMAGAQALFGQLLADCSSPTALLAHLNALGYVTGGEAPAGGDSALRVLYAQLLAASEQICGPDHPDVAAVLAGWGQQLMRDDEYEAAVPLLLRALTIHPQALADTDGTLLELLRSVDNSLSMAGEYGAVRTLYRHAYDACAPVLGAAHPHVLDLQARLSVLPDVLSAAGDGGAEGWLPNVAPSDGASELTADVDVLLYRMPARRAETEALRSIVRSGAGLAVAHVASLEEAIASTAEVLVLMLPGDRAVALSSEQIDRLQQRKVIGIGYGAARIFGDLGLEINAGACAHFGAMTMRLSVEPNQLGSLPGLGVADGLAHSGGLDQVDHVGLYIPKASHMMQVVDVIARETSDPNYALIARQGHHVLIGLVSSPAAWTPAYTALFAAIVRLLHAMPAQPFARAAWKTMQPGAYSLKLAPGRSTTESSDYMGHLRFAKPTQFSARLTIATSENVMLLFMGERREHWTREDGEAGDTLTIAVDITAEDLESVGDRYWHLSVVNFDTEQPATCELTIAYDE